MHSADTLTAALFCCIMPIALCIIGIVAYKKHQEKQQ